MSKTPQDKANAQFKKAQQAVEGAAAMAEYEAESLAVRERTAKLRALRLAKEAADLAAGGSKPAAGKKKTVGGSTAAAAKTKPAAKAKTGKKKDKGVPLSDWLSSQQTTGRRS